MTIQFTTKITPTKLRDLAKQFGYEVSQNQAKVLVNRFLSKPRSEKLNQKDFIKDEVNTFKEILDSTQLEIKQRHLLEIISRACFNQDWNTAGKLTVDHCLQNVLTKQGFLNKKHYDFLSKQEKFKTYFPYLIKDGRWLWLQERTLRLEFHSKADFIAYAGFIRKHLHAQGYDNFYHAGTDDPLPWFKSFSNVDELPKDEPIIVFHSSKSSELEKFFDDFKGGDFLKKYVENRGVIELGYRIRSSVPKGTMRISCRGQEKARIEEYMIPINFNKEIMKAENRKPRILQMATGFGKTYMILDEAHRLKPDMLDYVMSIPYKKDYIELDLPRWK